jgi:AraC-like DNA-binding protein
VHRGLPSSTLTFVISLAGPVDVQGVAGREPGPLRAFVAGLHAGPAEIHHRGVQFGIQIDVTPLGARRLFGVPAGELAHSVVSLDHLLGDESVRLSERLEGASTWRARFGVLDEVLLRRLSDTYVPNHAVAQAWTALAESGNTTTVSALAKQVGYSRCHLADLFSRELGLSPRAMARVIRFERSRVLLCHEG